MVQHIILPQIGLHSRMQWKTLWRETAIFWKPMKKDHDVLIPWSKILYYLRSDWTRKWIWKRYKRRPWCFGSPCRQTTVFWYHGPRYYTTSDWLRPGNGFEYVMTGDHNEGTGDSTRQPQPIITSINDTTSTLKIWAAKFCLVFVIFCVTAFIFFCPG